MIPSFSIVVAADEAGGIGKNGRLPWHLPGDLAYFRKLTIGSASRDPSPVSRITGDRQPATADGRNAVIMGRKTWQSIPGKFRPLPQRTNVVLSSNANLDVPDDVIVASGLDAALVQLERNEEIADAFVIGGGEIYREAIRHPGLERIYLTRVHANMGCDTFFPAIPSHFRLVSTSAAQKEDSVVYEFCVYEP